MIDRRNWIRQTATLLTGAAAGGLGTAHARQRNDGPAYLFPGFRTETVKTSGATINVVIGGSGPPLLLLHGAPQTHAIWHKVAPDLAKEYTVIAADLRGYGDSSKPEGGPNHVNYSKRAMALDQVEVMKHFGFARFAVVGHDRGARVTHRLTLDHPDAVTRAAILDIIPTHYFYNHVTRERATAYYHWFFLIRPAPFPETFINNSVETYVGPGRGEPEAEFLRAFKNPATVHAMCEDYRAGASIDLEHDDADLNRKIACPLLVLWGEKGNVGRLFDPMAVWRERATSVRGRAMPSGHNIQLDAPAQLLAELRTFLRE
ncbi:MAG: alpha/beta hydrolase [Acidobacteria bacterium]|nr:alpha/beta hydrolase [Acidobacteriota bacterium]